MEKISHHSFPKAKVMFFGFVLTSKNVLVRKKMNMFLLERQHVVVKMENLTSISTSTSSEKDICICTLYSNCCFQGPE